jgi:hypothetical protein
MTPARFVRVEIPRAFQCSFLARRITSGCGDLRRQWQNWSGRRFSAGFPHPKWAHGTGGDLPSVERTEQTAIDAPAGLSPGRVSASPAGTQPELSGSEWLAAKGSTHVSPAEVVVVGGLYNQTQREAPNAALYAGQRRKPCRLVSLAQRSVPTRSVQRDPSTCGPSPREPLRRGLHAARICKRFSRADARANRYHRSRASHKPARQDAGCT